MPLALNRFNGGKSGGAIHAGRGGGPRKRNGMKAKGKWGAITHWKRDVKWGR